MAVGGRRTFPAVAETFQCWRNGRDISGGWRDGSGAGSTDKEFGPQETPLGLYRGRCRFNLKNVWIHTMNSYRGSVEAEPTVVSFVSRLFLVSFPWRRETNTNNHFDHYWSMSSYNPLRILIIYAKYIGECFAQFFSILRTIVPCTNYDIILLQLITLKYTTLTIIIGLVT